MFVVVSTYRAKVGEEDAIIALHEDWQRNQGFTCRNYLSWELIQQIENPFEFIAIVHFPGKAEALAAAKDLEREGWHDRLLSLTERDQTHTDCMIVWHLW